MLFSLTTSVKQRKFHTSLTYAVATAHPCLTDDGRGTERGKQYTSERYYALSDVKIMNPAVFISGG